MSKPAANIPIKIPLPEYAVPEIVADVDFDDERLWVPRGDNVESLPLLFSVTQGSWVNITPVSYTHLTLPTTPYV